MEEAESDGLEEELASVAVTETERVELDTGGPDEPELEPEPEDDDRRGVLLPPTSR